MSDFLKAAHKQQRLAAIHIDLQPVYHSDLTAGAYENTRAFAQTMRESGIPNIWVTFPFHEPAINKRISSVADFNNAPFVQERERLCSTVNAMNDETVIIKTAVDGLQNGQLALETHLDTLKADTVLVTGVLGAGCVAATIGSAIMADRWNVIAIQDCIDMTSPAEYKQYISSLNSHHPGFHRRFRMAEARAVTGSVASAPSRLPAGLGRLLGWAL